MSLPNKIGADIFGYLTLADVEQVSEVCQMWGALLGHPSVVTAIQANTPTCNLTECYDGCLEPLIAAGYLELLQLRPRRKLTVSMVNHAALNGHVHILQWMVAVYGTEARERWNTWLHNSAAEGGQIEVLKWMHSTFNDIQLNELTCNCAAEGGHLNILIWLRSEEVNAPWDEWTCWYASLEGRLDVLKWARANGCLWDRVRCVNTAREYGHQHVVDWIEALPASEDNVDAGRQVFT